MDPIYLLTALVTVIGAVAGLVLTCHLERRSLNGRRSDRPKAARDHLGESGLTS